jgi:hypothetical protein
MNQLNYQILTLLGAELTGTLMKEGRLTSLTKTGGPQLPNGQSLIMNIKREGIKCPLGYQAQNTFRDGAVDGCLSPEDKIALIVAKVLRGSACQKLNLRFAHSFLLKRLSKFSTRQSTGGDWPDVKLAA